MTEDEGLATIALVVRDHPTIINGWIESRPKSIEVIQIVREDAGLKIVTASEMLTLVDGLYADLRHSTRKKLRVFYREQRNIKIDNTKEATP